ncbi:MAG TPA: hypothetical protein VFK13_10470 [Gemmatimonadaceae bacterium]|nr:hypothetical protein [Gemmatimonadaceae bacterium]
MVVSSLRAVHRALALAALTVLATVTLALPGTIVAQQPTTAQHGTDSLPPARQIIDRYVQAIGGRDAVMKHTSSRSFATFSAPGAGLTGHVESILAAPDRSSVRISIPGLGEQLTGFDGSHGWSIDPSSGPRLLEGKELESLKADHDLYESLHDPARFTSIETVERIDFEGRPCYKLKLVRTNGDTFYEFYDVSTGLLAGSIITAQTVMGPIEATNVVSDYKPFGGILIPTTAIQRAQQQEYRITIDSVVFDNVSADAFAPPAPIQALLKGQ